MKKPPTYHQPPSHSRVDTAARAANTLRQTQKLQELAEIGMVLLRRLAQRPPDNDVVRSFENMSQAVRRTIALEAELDSGPRSESIARAVERAQLMRELSRVPGRAPDPAEPEPEPVAEVKPKTGRILN
jgi:hypothetical protein